MATPVAQVVKVNWKLVFPWVGLFRTLGLALHVRQVLVGMIAALLIISGDLLIGGIPFPRSTPILALDRSLLSWIWLPWIDLVAPLSLPLFGDWVTVVVRRSNEWWYLLLALLRFGWGLIIGSLAGGILVRRAGLEFAREESVGLWATVRFVIKRSLDYVSAPALPLVAAGGLGVAIWVAGLIARLIPGGEYVVSLLWGLLFLAGTAMAVLLIAVVLGWPMMIAAVSLNGGDGFDGLSRGFGFVLDRWRYYAWCIAIMSAYGTLSMSLLWIVLRYGDFLAVTALSWGDQSWWVQQLPRVTPEFFWQTLIVLFFRGFAYSYFWSSMAIIYLLLRQSLDNAELHDIYVEGSPQDPDGLQALVNPTQPEPSPPTLLPIINQP